MSPAAKAVVDYDKSGEKPTKKYRIAYLTECVDNPYCLARLAGLKAAAEKYGFEFKIFDANFSPATQAKVVENAVTEGFDGYLFGPAAAQPGCGLYNRLLKPTGKPVVSIDIAMCGDPDYTPGLAATLTMQGPAHFNEAIDTAFASCTGTCSVAAVGGFVGSDLFTYWENAIKAGAKKYPNVKVVVDEPANFDPRIALTKIQSALLAHPDISIIISSWDDMSRGVEQAIIAAGKTPGKDVKDLLRRRHQSRRRQGQGRHLGADHRLSALSGSLLRGRRIDDGARRQADQRLHRRSVAAGDRQHHRHDLHHQGQRRQVRAGLLIDSRRVAIRVSGPSRPGNP